MARTLTRADLAEMGCYVALSLATALAGGLVAVSLVPLIQPGQPLPLADRLLNAGGRVELQAGVFMLVTAVFALLRWLGARLGARLVGRYGVRLRQQVHARLLSAPLASLADASSAEIANVLTHNVEIAVQGLSALLQLLVAGLTCAVSLALALWVSPPMLLAVPVLVGMGLLTARLFAHEQADVSRRYVTDMTNLFWHSEDFPRRLRHVRSFAREDEEQASYGDVTARLGEGYRRQLELVASGRLAQELLATVGIAVMFLIGHRLREVDQASLIAVCLLLGRLLPYLVATRQGLQQLRSAGPALALWQRYMQLAAGGADAPVNAPTMFADALFIEHLRVTPPMKGLTIDGLVLVPGGLTLVSGLSGIGKSSLIDVLAGMMPPQAFSARLGERAISYETYRRLVRNGAYVSQSVRPWQRTVRECLLWAAPAASEQSMRDALADVDLDRRLAGSPHGLDTALSSASSRLSGGELQRLMLAQVILRQPSLALLDEATSALDAAAELRVLAALRQRLPRTILVVVSHRSGVAAVADQELVIDDDGAASIIQATSAHEITGAPRRQPASDGTRRPA
ncbi:ATP-binding cassette domain-containing protein [Dyella solisilvae]|uniref:ATP-binding cassette domain-containing protein n=1 Tax=Dyella solisilvae TaxID=1920168 RepID=UPI001F3FA955|nr:ABC transporter ATP-binding protein [Dyella solisilvae]